MTAQPVNVGAQGAQPTAQHGRAAHWAFYVALVFWAVGVFVDWAGYTVQGYAGVVVGGAALGVSIAYAAAHDWAGRRAHRAAHTQPTLLPEMWAPMSAAQARAVLTRLAQGSRNGSAQ